MKRLLFIACSLALCSITFNGISQHHDSVAIGQEELIERADSLMANYKFEEALNVLARGDSSNLGILLRVGQCNARMGASTAAIRPYERVLQMDSSNIVALNQLGILYTRDGDLEDALSCYIHLIKLDSTNSYYYKQAGSTAMRLNAITTAKFWFEKALRFNPADVEVSLALGNALFEIEAYESVDSIVEQALALDPHFKPLILLSAKSAFEQQHYESAIVTINKLLEKSDTTAQLARLLGISYFHLREYNKVVTCMQFLLKNRYDFEWIYYYMGISFRELGDMPASINWLKVAVQKSISENTTTYYSQLAHSYEQMGEYQEAIRAYRAAYNYSKDGILLYHLARNYDVYYKDKSMALEYYQKYLESDDTIRLAREYARKRMQDMGQF